MLKETVIAALEAHFGAEVILTPSSREFASFDAKHPDVGNVVIEDDGKELIVSVGNIHHGHFASYEDGLSAAEHEAVIVDQLIGFLLDLFADKSKQDGAVAGFPLKRLPRVSCVQGIGNGLSGLAR